MFLETKTETLPLDYKKKKAENMVSVKYCVIGLNPLLYLFIV